MTYSTLEAPVRGGQLHAGRWSPGDGAGAGATVLAVHGVTATHRSWNSVAAGAPDLDILAPDLRGRGRSRGLPGPAGLHQHAEDLARLLDDAGVDRAVVVGHSMGALVSVVFADDHPDRVERLVLVDGGLPLYPLPGRSPEETMEITLGPALSRLTTVFPTRASYLDFWRQHPAFAGGIDEHMADYFDYDLVEVDGGLASSVVGDLVRDDVVSQLAPDVLTPALEHLRVPAVLLRAPRGLLDQPDALYTSEEAAEWEARLPLLRVVEVPDVNHYTIIFDQDAVKVVVAEIRNPPAP
jgi:pimeloyl-ACP methyl ester carboxylesterase